MYSFTKYKCNIVLSSDWLPSKFGAKHAVFITPKPDKLIEFAPSGSTAAALWVFFFLLSIN